MKVLIACEFSGTVRDAFAALGHDAWSCDILPTEKPGNHFQKDIFHLLCEPFAFTWDLIIAHPPCQYLANSGVRWLWNKDGSKNIERWAQMEKAAIFFRSLLYSNCERIAVENPIQHKHAKEIIGVNQTQTIQPWQFGHGETKATCLWLKNLPPLKPTNIVGGRTARVHREPPSPERWKNRSRTLEGIAKGMAEQWGNQ